MWFEDPEPSSWGRCLPFSVVTHRRSCVGPSVRKAKALQAGVPPRRGLSLRETLKLPLGDLKIGSALLHGVLPKLQGLSVKCPFWRPLSAEAAPAPGTGELKGAEERGWGLWPARRKNQYTGVLSGPAVGSVVCSVAGPALEDEWRDSATLERGTWSTQTWVQIFSLPIAVQVAGLGKFLNIGIDFSGHRNVEKNTSCGF